jgi:carbon monoxide dehydrogenase subunit G
MKMELLGRLATLGAVPIRRRADEVFKEFVERIHAELAT